MLRYVLCLLVCLIANPGVAQDDFGKEPPVQIDATVCENAFEATGAWRHADRAALEASLTAASEMKAVRTFFAEELSGFEETVIPETEIVSALRNRLRYDEARLSAGESLDFCITLQGCRIDSDDRKKFGAVEIGRVCNINPTLVQTQTEIIKEAFATWMTGEPTEGKSLGSIFAMAADPDRIEDYESDALKTLVHEIEVAPGEESLSGSACVSLIVYPVEIYTATVVKDSLN